MIANINEYDDIHLIASNSRCSKSISNSNTSNTTADDDEEEILSWNENDEDSSDDDSRDTDYGIDEE